MPDLFAKAATWLANQCQQSLARPITYRRGGLSVVAKATVGRTNYEIDEGNGVMVRSQSRDYVMRAADLVLGGVRVVPQRGDRIEESPDLVHEVVSVAGQNEWSYADPSRVLMRIHTKEVQS
jgi:hypothetical protein